MTWRLQPNRVTTVLALAMLILTSVGCKSGSAQADAGTSEGNPMRIVDVNWQLKDVEGNPTEPVPADARAPYLRLNSADKHVNGYSGVNQFNGGYELTSESLRFGPMAMTRRAGPEALNRQESAFAKALSETRSWRVSGDSLEIPDLDGKPVATFTRPKGP